MNGILLSAGTGYNYNSATGQVVISKAVDGNITINAVYTVTASGTGLGITPTSASFDTMPTLTLTGTPPSNVAVTMNGTMLSAGTDYTYNSVTGQIVMIKAVDGNIVATAVYTVTMNGTGLTVAPATATFGAMPTLTLTGTFPSNVTVTMGGTVLTATQFTYTPGTITINVPVTGNIVINAIYTVTVTGTTLGTTTPTATFGTKPTLTLTGTPPPSVTVTMGGTSLSSGIDYNYSSTGQVAMVSSVTGNIVINAEYTVTVNGTGLSTTTPTATYGSAPTLILTGTFPSDVTVTMNGVVLTNPGDYTYNSITGQVGISKSVDGNIVVTAVYTVTATESGNALACNPISAAFGLNNVDIMISAVGPTHITSIVSITMGGSTLGVGDYVYAGGDSVKINGPITGDIAIIVTIASNNYTVTA
jgi:hypothetical protein